MREFLKPKVVVSKCIEFDYCRWNANIIKSPIVEILKNFVEFIPVCAEVEIGLGVPRDSVRIVKKDEELRLIQRATQKDFTQEMLSFCNDFLDGLGYVDGFILKSQSPSCGLYQTKYYHAAKKGASTTGRGPGFFGISVLEKFPHAAIETEGRLRNFIIREHWLIQLFSLSDFNEVSKSGDMHELVQFQTRNKLLFMAYNQNLMREMGRIVANIEKKSFQEIIANYREKFRELISKPPKYTSHINVLMHALGYFKKKLSHEEKSYFLDELEKFRTGWTPAFIPMTLLKSWIVRFGQDYLTTQTYFEPYPEKLMNFDLKDTWRGRNYWKEESSK